MQYRKILHRPPRPPLDLSTYLIQLDLIRLSEAMHHFHVFRSYAIEGDVSGLPSSGGNFTVTLPDEAM